MELIPITLTRKTGHEHFTLLNTDVGFSLSDYWSQAHSDLISNTERGKIAEFIVASALDIAEKPSNVQDSFDLLYKGKGIEVKPSAYVQSWRQKKESYISFSVRPTLGLIEDTGAYDDERR